MTNTEVKEKKVNLSTYYILPLLKLNMASFGEDNFIKSQVTKFGEVVVFIKDSEKAGDYWNHENFAADVDEEEETMIIYNIPDRFLRDYQMFLESKYSKMSMFAKDAIIAHAKANDLIYSQGTGKYVNVERMVGEHKRVFREEVVNSSSVLLALDKNPDLKIKLEKELDVTLSDEAELWDAVSEEDIIKLN